jgi:ribosome-associated translation inhibitor RaiA
MPYYSITLDGKIYSQNIGYFTTINIHSDTMYEALNTAIKKIRTNVLRKYQYYTDNFTITDIEELDFRKKQTDYYFYNL